MKKIIKIFTILIAIAFSQTTDQIRQAKDMIKRTGMSESQVRDAAKARGFTDKQIDAVINKQKNVDPSLEDSNPKNIEKTVLPELGVSNQNVNKNELNLLEAEKLSHINDNLQIIDNTVLTTGKNIQNLENSLSHFGYDIFSRDPTLFQSASVGAVDPNYLIGPGDEIIAMLWGETQFRQVLTVDREGFVFIPEIGQVFVNGLNLSLLESKLFRVFSQSYASLSPQGRAPTSFLDISIGNLRPLRIQVLGEVNQPGAYTVSPSSTLFSSLYYFNGPTTLGSLRDIHLIRGGEKIESIDFYDFLLTGKNQKIKSCNLMTLYLYLVD